MQLQQFINGYANLKDVNCNFKNVETCWGRIKIEGFSMCLNLNYYQHKINYYKMFYISLMVTTRKNIW